MRYEVAERKQKRMKLGSVIRSQSLPYQSLSSKVYLSYYGVCGKYPAPQILLLSFYNRVRWKLALTIFLVFLKQNLSKVRAHWLESL